MSDAECNLIDTEPTVKVCSTLQDSEDQDSVSHLFLKGTNIALLMVIQDQRPRGPQQYGTLLLFVGSVY